MYRYIQLSEKDAWVPVKSEDIEEKIQELQAKRVTILEVTELVDDEDGRDKRNYSYRGPLYFDIDCKSDIKLAIESSKTLADKLIELGMPQHGIRIFASGSKGMHVTVDQKYFSSGRPRKALPLIYKVMAKELYVPGMDFQVYSCGKGNAFRIQNVQRGDGKYRVPILYEELKDLSVKKYQQLVKAPRNIEVIEPTPMKVALLNVLFDDACREVNNKPQPKLIISSPANLEKLKEEVPPCIQRLCDWKGVRSEKNLNEAAMQLGIFIGRIDVSSVVADGLVSRMADNSSSSKYNSIRARHEHIRGSVAYMKNSEGYHFSCASMRGLLDKPPCEDCAIKDSPEAANSASATLGLIEREDGMFMLGKNADRIITNFTMVPTDHYIDVPKDGSKGRRVGTKIEVFDSGEFISSIVFHESSWLSRSAFMKDTTEGHGVLTFFGSDNDVQAIKGHVLRKEASMGEIFRVHTCGVHLETVGGTEIMTYVEPDMSINTNRIQNTHEFAGSMVARPYFSESDICSGGDEAADTALFNMLDINQPIEMGLLIGWFAACHLKQHVMNLYSQFPILAVWGSAGSGKSVTVSLLSWINGTDYTMRDTPVNVSNITQYAILEYASSTTTVPRVLEEYNKSKMRSAHWKSVGEVLKASWNGEAILRGGLADKKEAGRSGAKVNEIPITGPLVVISEQELEMPALQERSIRVHMSKEKRGGKRAQLKLANRGRKKLREVGKALMALSLKTTSEEVEDIMDEMEELVPEELDDRPRYSYQICLLGLVFMKKVVSENLKLPQSSKKLDEIYSAMEKFLEDLGENAQEMAIHSEIDSVLEDMNIMASVPRAGGESWLLVGEHYIVAGDDKQYLIIDPLMCHTLYKQYSRTVGSMAPVIDSTKQFMKLIKDESYFIEYKPVAGMASNRPVVKLDRYEMVSKGLETRNFI